MSEISKIQIGDVSYDVVDESARSRITTLEKNGGSNSASVSNQYEHYTWSQINQMLIDLMSPSTGLVTEAIDSESGFLRVTGIGTCKDNCVRLENMITHIGDAAFNAVRTIHSIIFEDEMCSYVGNNAFQDCANLRDFRIKNPTYIGAQAFKGCTSLETVVIECNTSVSFALRDGTFSNCTALKSIKIPDGVTAIYSNGFFNCSSLTSIEIPNSVKSIGVSAFEDCSSLTSIMFGGTKTEWEAVEKKSYWNSNTGDYTVYCTDGNVAKA